MRKVEYDFTIKRRGGAEEDLLVEYEGLSSLHQFQFYDPEVGCESLDSKVFVFSTHPTDQKTFEKAVMAFIGITGKRRHDDR